MGTRAHHARLRDLEEALDESFGTLIALLDGDELYVAGSHMLEWYITGQENNEFWSRLSLSARHAVSALFDYDLRRRVLVLQKLSDPVVFLHTCDALRARVVLYKYVIERTTL